MRERIDVRQASGIRAEWLLELDVFSLASVNSLSAGFCDSAFSEASFDGDNAAVAGGVMTLRFSTHGYISHASDSPANTSST